LLYLIAAKDISWPIKGSLVQRAIVIGDVIHTDLAGPIPPTISGYKYA
jgi:hypothetical protein